MSSRGNSKRSVDGNSGKLYYDVICATVHQVAPAEGWYRHMGDLGGGKGVVVAIRPRHRSHAMCTCGWVGRPRLLAASAKVDALIHAARDGCGPAVPLVQPETVNLFEPPAILTVSCPAGCGASLSMPVMIAEAPWISSDDNQASSRFTAEAPELHDRIYEHLRTCQAVRTWGDTRLPDIPAAWSARRIG